MVVVVVGWGGGGGGWSPAARSSLGAGVAQRRPIVCVATGT
eukprot:COSAG02_NODE_67504_length_253_cov_0.233766_1_plen_40_part_01